MVWTKSLILHLFVSELAMSTPPDVKSEAACNQMVPYNPTNSAILPMFSQRTRNFDFSGKNWVVKQDWDEIGVASVVWEPVSFSL